MADPSRVGMSGPLRVYARGFAIELSRQGYAPRTAAMKLQLMARVSRWLAAQDMAAGDLSVELVERYFVARRAEGYVTQRTPPALAPLLVYLRGLGVTPAELPPDETPVDVVLARYREYLVVERGLAAGTIGWYVALVRPFVEGRVVGGRVVLEDLTASEVTAFVLAECRRRPAGTAKLVVSALRSLLRYLHVEGLVGRDLVGAVPAVAGWQLTGLPRPLDRDEVRRLVAACDRRTVAGRRDFAILLLLSRLGLRVGEVATLELDDIDWRGGELVVMGKGGRVLRLPLPGDVGAAVACWLRRGRPLTAQGRCVFVRLRPPHGPLTASGVSSAVVGAGERAGLGTVAAHRLRHSAASEMLGAGAPLEEIGQVLGHRKLATTAIYAKIDRQALRALARPWPITGGAR